MTEDLYIWGDVVQVRPYPDWCGVTFKIRRFEGAKAPLPINGFLVFVVKDVTKYMPKKGDTAMACHPADGSNLTLEETFICDGPCGGEWPKLWSDEEAYAEADATFGDQPKEKLGTVCEDCFARVMGQFN